ncbi:MAG: ABC transporter ATP-binding protein [Acetobacteraceae bacterium]|nr:ABC transporter ATP-binding protein [Acetobacteraceae bacterium]
MPDRLMLDVQGLEVSYGATRVLEGVSFSVLEGRIVALLGGNGSGKSTVLNTLSGLLRPQKGVILLSGRNVAGRPTHEIVRGGMAQVPQGREVFASMTVAENLDLGATTRHDKAEVGRDREDVFALFPRLRERFRRRAGSLSGGEQQMVAIGRALMSHPRILLMDEPSVGLSPAVVGDMIEAIRMLHARGLTVLLVEQNVGVAAAVAHEAKVLQGGRIAYSGPAAGLLDNEEVLRSYLG